MHMGWPMKGPKFVRHLTIKGINMKFPTCEKQKIKKNTGQRKNNYIHETVFT